MSTPTPSAAPGFLATARRHLAPFLVPYYLTIAHVLCMITVGFVVLTVLIILVAANFNLLGWME